MSPSRKFEVLRSLLSFDNREPDKTLEAWRTIAKATNMRPYKNFQMHALAHFLSADRRNAADHPKILNDQLDETWQKLEKWLIDNHELKP